MHSIRVDTVAYDFNTVIEYCYIVWRYLFGVFRIEEQTDYISMTE